MGIMSPRRRILTFLGTVFFFTYLSLYIVASLLTDRFLGFPKLLPTPANIIVSLPFLTVGLFINLWAIVEFVKAKGTPVRFNPPPNLVTTGPYAHVRNPQSVSWPIIFIGLGALFRSISLVFIFTPLLFLVDILAISKMEERRLEKRFGEEFTEYKRKVPKYIPRLKERTKE
jgi:protein-S-isoprenylcysteine O-methyltransferase Ste14